MSEQPVEEWLAEQLDALADAFDLDDDQAMAAVMVASLAHEVGDVVLERLDAEGSDLASGGEELQAYATEVLSSPAGGDEDPGEGLDAETLLQILPHLRDPDVAEATLSQTLNTLDPEGGHEAVRAAALGLGTLAEFLVPQAPVEARPALHWLWARAAEALADTEEAERLHEAALDSDPDWSPALYDLARVANDRGDAVRALSLLRRSRAREDDVLVETLQRFVPRDRTDIGRNDPCWCGSGRKYKACHRGRETLTLAERLPWLVAKADLHLTYGGAGVLLHAVAAWWTDGQREPEAQLDALADPLLRDAVLFEGAGLQVYLHERGALLPDDESELAARLVAAPRQVLDVEVPGSSTVRVRPVAGTPGEPTESVEVDSRSLAGVRKGDVVAARLVEIDERWHAFGTVELIDPAAALGLAEGLAAGPDAYETVQLVFDAMPAQ
ncbi:SEC-C domain-containing protein [Nocardioidaceae bacterium]|nr:SEC-C domain-containing protein [Nocardioidaceae bacterium]